MNAVFSGIGSITVKSSNDTRPQGNEATPATPGVTRLFRNLVIPSSRGALAEGAPIDQESTEAIEELLFTRSPVALLCPIVLAASNEWTAINSLIDVALNLENHASRACVAALAATDIKQPHIVDRLVEMLAKPGNERAIALKALSGTSGLTVTNKLLELVETPTLPADADRVVDALLTVARNDERIGAAYLRVFTEWTATTEVSGRTFGRAFAVGACKTGALQMDVGARKIRAALTPDQIVTWESYLKELFNRDIFPEQVCLMLSRTESRAMKVWLTEMAFLPDQSNEVRAFAACGARDGESVTPLAVCGGRSPLSHFEESQLWDRLPRTSPRLGVAFRKSTWERGVSALVAALGKGQEADQMFAAYALSDSQNEGATEALIAAAVNADSARVRAVALSGLSAEELFPWKQKLIDSLDSRASAAEVVEISRVFGDDHRFADAFVRRVISHGGVREGEFEAEYFTSSASRGALAQALLSAKLLTPKSDRIRA